MKKSYLQWFFVLGTGLFLGACSDDKTIDPPIITDPVATAPSRYVVASAPVGSSGIADYLLTTSDLSQGTISTVGKGIEQDGSYRYYLTHKGKFFSLLYGQGNPGAVTTYTLSETGELVKSSDFQSETVQVFAPAGDDILTIKVPRSGNESASWFRINADQSKIVGEGQINIVRLAGNGERAHFTWATQVGDKIFAPYMSIKGAAPDVFGTAYPDSSWIAVFSYPEMQLEKVIKDNRTSFIGSYFNNGLLVDENGDTYAFSPAVATSSGKQSGTKPSAFVRIKKGTTEFDQSYYFNVQEKSGGKKVIGQTYLGKGKSLLYMLTDPADQYGPTRLAISDIYNQTFTWVTGTPESIASRSASYNNNTVSADGKTIFVGINTDAGSWVYAIDIATATARQGLKVEGGAITAIVKVK
ncbi:DUF4374 domain-containing protein [Dyadobacter sediminis]|uniref:DUF4374 domain-containing protein n=1 Tax=Dyadobacter sediminis TaxID=1493691 RepID=A0A5R9KBI8_9BACT|nr:DUF4374 domain-containing protein [Dyadobacter sediminis]TLU92176.1 DUF4374 domain-containing protein [Dyadobacter sediminis]GGB96785.1 hypothetical protein GCM10011325_25140 [Dyadobacter sediminis]